MQHAIVALVFGNKKEGLGRTYWNGIPDPQLSAGIFAASLITLFSWSLNLSGTLLNTGVSFCV
jgi:hypothetical protein